jgi:hypothetical protein
MALLPEVHVNLDRPTIQHIYQLFLPIVPGGALVIGYAMAHPQHVKCFVAGMGIGYYSLIAAAVFIAYVAGLMLFALSIHVGAMFSFWMGWLCGKIPRLLPIRNNVSTSQSHVWRTVAASFLGDELSPKPPTVEGATGLFTTSAQFTPPAPVSVYNYDVAWNDWYNVLQDYVLHAPPLNSEGYFLFTIVQATCWAVIAVSFHPRFSRHHPFALILVCALALLTALVQFIANYAYLKYDRLSALDFTARLVAAIRARDDPNRGGSIAVPKS